MIANNPEIINKKKKENENIAGYVFISPMVIGIIVFTIIPMITSLYYSFNNMTLVSPPKFVGFDNYIKLSRDPKFIKSFVVTLKYAVVSVPLRLAVSLFIAMLLNQKHRMISFYRTIMYLPSIVGGSVAVAVMWRQIFMPTGIFNSALTALGKWFYGSDYIFSFLWLADERTALSTLILMAIWQFGSPMLIFLAGIKNIPISYYESAIVDGANASQKFFRITLPLITPIILFNLVMQTINGFMAFTQALIVTQGKPLNSTLFYALYLYQKMFQDKAMGYASAMAWVLLIFIGLVTALIFRSTSAWVYYESKGDM